MVSLQWTDETLSLDQWRDRRTPLLRSRGICTLSHCRHHHHQDSAANWPSLDLRDFLSRSRSTGSCPHRMKQAPGMWPAIQTRRETASTPHKNIRRFRARVNVRESANNSSSCGHVGQKKIILLRRIYFVSRNSTLGSGSCNGQRTSSLLLRRVTNFV